MSEYYCAHAHGPHDKECDLVAGLTRENAELRRCLSECCRVINSTLCPECHRLYEHEPWGKLPLPICNLVDHVEANAAIQAARKVLGQ